MLMSMVSAAVCSVQVSHKQNHIINNRWLRPTLVK